MSAGKKRHVARSPEDIAIKRDRILDAALRLVRDRGYTKTTMSAVAAEAGVGRGTLYWHYDSKDDLVYAMMEREIQRLMEIYAPMGDLEGRAIEKIEMLIRISFDSLEAANELMKPLVSVVASGSEELDLRLLELWGNLYAQYNAMVAALLEQGKVEGDVREDLDSEVAAAAMVGLLDAMYLQHVFGHLPQDTARVSRAVLALLGGGYLGGGR